MSNEFTFYKLGSKFPLLDSIIIGCHADKEIIPHECCECDIISVYDDNTIIPQNLVSEEGPNLLHDKKKVYEVLILSAHEFMNNPNINYTNFVQIPRQFMKSNIVNHFLEKCDKYNKSFTFELKTNVIENICEITTLLGLLAREFVDERYISFQLKMLSLKTLKTLIHFYLNSQHRPSHLKYQINLVKQNENLKTRENVDMLLEYMGTNRANISSYTRSEKSLRFLTRNEDYRKNRILFNKLEFFKNKSMYVDGILLINSFIQDKIHNEQIIKKYNKLLNHIIDIQTKEKITMLKEVNSLLEINKNLI